MTTVTTETETRTVTVLAERKAEALEALKKLMKKAAKYGCGNLSVTVGETRRESHTTIDDWDGTRKVTVTVVDLHVTGGKVAVGDYVFLARVERAEVGNIVNTVPGAEIADHWRETDGHCDHCNVHRRRNDVFIVRERSTGTEKVIGRNCLRDYLGVDPAAVIGRFRWYSDFGGFGESFGGRSSWGRSLESMLSATATAIRLFGWNSKKAAEINNTTATATYVNLVFADPSTLDRDSRALAERMRTERTESDATVAKATIAWARAMASPKNDYMHNVKMILSDDTVHDPRHVGIAVSAVAAYHRDMEFALRMTARRASDAASRPVGSVGERLRGITGTLESSRVVGGNSFGECVLVKLRDTEGNLYSWFTGRGAGMEAGERVVFDGTVKRHSEFRGTHETVLSRVTLRAAPARADDYDNRDDVTDRDPGRERFDSTR